MTGAGVAFLGLYLWHSLLISWVAHRLSAFRLSTANRGLVLTYIPLAACVFAAFQILSFWQATALGSAAAVLSGVHSLKILYAAPASRICCRDQLEGGSANQDSVCGVLTPTYRITF